MVEFVNVTIYALVLVLLFGTVAGSQFAAMVNSPDAPPTHVACCGVIAAKAEDAITPPPIKTAAIFLLIVFIAFVLSLFCMLF